MISWVAYTITNTFLRKRRLRFVEGGACAMAQWHNGQSKTDNIYFIAAFILFYFMHMKPCCKSLQHYCSIYFILLHMKPDLQ